MRTVQQINEEIAAHQAERESLIDALQYVNSDFFAGVPVEDSPEVKAAKDLLEAEGYEVSR